MKGMAIAFEGRLGRDAEVRATNAGHPFMKLAVAVGEDEAREWMDVSAWSSHLIELAPHLVKGVAVYCQGTLKVRRWTAPEGPRLTLQVSAEIVQPLALIGRAKPKAARAKKANGKVDSQRPIGAGEAGRPFDDDLPF